MTAEQPKALMLADVLEATHPAVWPYGQEAAAELRRLYAENGSLKSCLFQMQEAAKWGVAKHKDEALLRQVLEVLEFIPASGSMLGAQAEAKRVQAIAAIKERLK